MHDESSKVRQIDHRVIGDEPGRKPGNTWTTGIEIKELPKRVLVDALVGMLSKLLIFISGYLLHLFTGGLGFF